MDRSDVDKAYDHVRGIYRNYPDWPSTFNPCTTDDCDGWARGCGMCADCHEKALAKYAGEKAARKFHDLVKEKSEVYSELIDAIGGLTWKNGA